MLKQLPHCFLLFPVFWSRDAKYHKSIMFSNFLSLFYCSLFFSSLLYGSLLSPTFTLLLCTPKYFLSPSLKALFFLFRSLGIQCLSLGKLLTALGSTLKFLWSVTFTLSHGIDVLSMQLAQHIPVCSPTVTMQRFFSSQLDTVYKTDDP